MKKSINELDVVLLYVSKIKDSTGLDCYVFKNNLDLPLQTIVGARSDFKTMSKNELAEYRDYIASSLMKIIKKLSHDWKSIGDKKIKLVFNKTDASISLSMDVDNHGNLEVLSTEKTIPFDSIDIDFFDEVTLSMKI